MFYKLILSYVVIAVSFTNKNIVFHLTFNING